jgi:predicted transcriptional regulator
MHNKRVLLEVTADTVGVYVANRRMPSGDLPNFIASVYASFAGLRAAPGDEKLTRRPAVNPRRSVHDNHIVCLEDGKRFRTLTRHLLTQHGLTPEEYRARWNLWTAYPMSAPSYAADRSALAKSMGLGHRSATKIQSAARAAAKRAAVNRRRAKVA